MPYLFDASSLLNLFLAKNEASIDIVKDNSVLDLTFYEVGNALRRMQKEGKLSLSEARELIDIVSKMAPLLSVVVVSELKLVETLNLAVDESTTFYDAAYVVAASMRKLDLVTDDGKLAKLARRYAKVKTSKEL